METKILLPKDFCKMEAIKYVASRYGTIPEKVLKHYFVQTGIVPSGNRDDDGYELQSNYLTLFHDLGVHPTAMEIK